MLKLRVLLAVVALVSSACYKYAPIQGIERDVGLTVRLRLTDQGSIDLAPYIGPTITTVEGTVSAVSDSALTLSMTNAVQRNGIETPWKGERVVFPRSKIASIQEKSIDRGRSWLLAGGGVAATLAIGAAFNLLGGSNGGKVGPAPGGTR